MMSLTRSMALRPARKLRPYSDQAGQKPVSPHVGFYKTFYRPVSKVLLMAVLTYQVAYWGWVKLEKEEIKKGKKVELESLEKQLADLKKMKEAS